MDGKTTRWLKGCGCSLAVLIVLVIVAIIGSSIFMMKPFREGMEIRERLDREYGAQSEYTPAPDGSVLPDRMERFLTVRRELMPTCSRFEEAYDSLNTLEQFDGQDDPPKGEILKAVFKTARGAFGLAPAFGDFILARNRALLENGVGLGEYTYIYSLAYGDRLVEVESEGDTTRIQVHVSGRVLGVLQDMLRRQLEVAEPGSAWAGTLSDELNRMEIPLRTVPWADGLPPAIETSMAPYRPELEENFCAHTVELELSINRTTAGGIGIQGD